MSSKKPTKKELITAINLCVVDQQCVYRYKEGTKERKESERVAKQNLKKVKRMINALYEGDRVDSTQEKETNDIHSEISILVDKINRIEINNQEDLDEAIEMLDAVWTAKKILTDCIESYENDNIHVDSPSPEVATKFRMEQEGWIEIKSIK